MIIETNVDINELYEDLEEAIIAACDGSLFSCFSIEYFKDLTGQILYKVSFDEVFGRLKLDSLFERIVLCKFRTIDDDVSEIEACRWLKELLKSLFSFKKPIAIEYTEFNDCEDLYGTINYR